MLHGVKTGTLGEHPTRKNPLHFSRELHFIDFDEGGGVGRLGRRPGVAYPWRHFQRTELHRLIHRDFKMGDAPRNLVERGKYGDFVP